jgi:hypothetical protein
MRQPKPSPILESDFQKQVIEIGRLFGWKITHFRPAQTSKGWRTPVAADGQGFPDLVMVNFAQGRIIFAEIKNELGQPSAEQFEWLEDIENCGIDGVETYLWRPSDFETITNILKGARQ